MFFFLVTSVKLTCFSLNDTEHDRHRKYHWSVNSRTWSSWTDLATGRDTLTENIRTTKACTIMTNNKVHTLYIYWADTLVTDLLIVLCQWVCRLRVSPLKVKFRDGRESVWYLGCVMNWGNYCNRFLFNCLIKVKSIGLLLNGHYAQVGQLKDIIFWFERTVSELQEACWRGHAFLIPSQAVTRGCRYLGSFPSLQSIASDEIGLALRSSATHSVTGILIISITTLPTFITKKSWKVMWMGISLKDL